MARYQIILTYDGTDFFGSQRQGRTRTVQSVLEKALTRVGWKGSSILLAGRTDSGVHASGQVATCDLEWGHGVDDLRNALNANLPKDMAVSQVAEVDGSFHPRFSATARKYRYHLFCSAERDPLRERYAWRVWPEVTALESLAGIWTGAHDFSAFGSAVSPGGSTLRTVKHAAWTRNGEAWIFEIEADAFLYRMVRRLVYVQVAVGQGRASAEDLHQALTGGPEERGKAQKRIPAGLALPTGLTLVEVRYDHLA